MVLQSLHVHHLVHRTFAIVNVQLSSVIVTRVIHRAAQNFIVTLVNIATHIALKIAVGVVECKLDLFSKVAFHIWGRS